MNSWTPPPDQQQRDTVETQLDATLFVEAGAGTGKTTALVKRIVALISSGTPVNEIAATTFTEKAAAEMKERVRNELARRAEDQDSSEDIRRRCFVAAQDLDSAVIETLHGFARRILALYPLEAGLPPGFEILDEIQGQIAFEDQWSLILEEMLADEALQEALQRSLRLGLRVKLLKELALRFHQNWDRISEHSLDRHPDLSELFDRFEKCLDSVCALLKYCTEPEDRLAKEIEKQNALRREFRSHSEVWPKLKILLNYRRPALNAGSQKNWKIEKAQIKEECENAEAQATELQEQARMGIAAPLVKYLLRKTLDYADQRKCSGRLEFHDLLVLAVRLLRENSEVRQALHHRWSCLLIDEYQDTDPLQIEIASLITHDPRTPLSSEWHWTQAQVPAGRLLFVGDPKQSIYRFRRADVGLFHRTQETVGSGCLELTTNFRSHEHIIHWVNSVFKRVLGEGQDNEYSPLQPGRADNLPGSGQIYLLGTEMDSSADKIREYEAEDVVRVISQAMSDKWPVAVTDEAGEWALRDPRLSDVAILLPTRTSLPTLEAALQNADLPYRLESQSLVYNSSEVRECLAILRAVDDPSDQVSLIAALRASALACTDQDLWEFKSQGGQWDFLRTQSPPVIDLKVAKAMATLAKYHHMRLGMTPSALLTTIVRDLRMMELASARRRPRESWRRIRFLIERAQAFVAATGGTLRQFLRWCELQADSDARVSESILPETDDDAVRVLTIHAAKGLEFPIVILSGMSAGSRKADSVRVLWDEENQLGLKFGSKSAQTCFRTAGMAELEREDAEQDEAEKNRLLYVAATRARDHLAVSLYHKKSTDTAGLGKRLYDACEDREERRLPAVVALTPPVPKLPSETPVDSIEERSKWIEERARLLEMRSSMRLCAATTVAREMSTTTEFSEEDTEPNIESAFTLGSHRRSGTTTGRAVHAVLQSINLTDPAGLVGTAEAQARAEGLTSPDDIRRVRALTQKALASDSVQAAIRGEGGYWREVFVSAEVEGTLLEGFIDLLYQTPDGAYHIVDYKTDTAAHLSEEELLQRYAPQGCSYALAFEACMGCVVSDVVFLFLSHSPALEMPVSNLEQGKERVRAYLRDRNLRDHSSSSGFPGAAV